MPKLGVVESRICRGSGDFGGGVERFVGFGLPPGCGGFWGSVCTSVWTAGAGDFEH